MGGPPRCTPAVDRAAPAGRVDRASEPLVAPGRFGSDHRRRAARCGQGARQRRRGRAAPGRDRDRVRGPLPPRRDRSGLRRLLGAARSHGRPCARSRARGPPARGGRNHRGGARDRDPAARGGPPPADQSAACPLAVHRPRALRPGGAACRLGRHPPGDGSRRGAHRDGSVRVRGPPSVQPPLSYRALAGGARHRGGRCASEERPAAGARGGPRGLRLPDPEGDRRGAQDLTRRAGGWGGDLGSPDGRGDPLQRGGRAPFRGRAPRAGARALGAHRGRARPRRVGGARVGWTRGAGARGRGRRRARRARPAPAPRERAPCPRALRAGGLRAPRPVRPLSRPGAGRGPRRRVRRRVNRRPRPGRRSPRGRRPSGSGSSSPRSARS